MMNKLINSKIIEIVKVVHPGEPTSTPLQLFFKLKLKDSQDWSFVVGITNDGESLYAKMYQKAIMPKEILDNIHYGEVIIVNESDALFKLIAQEITGMYFGNGTATRIDDAGNSVAVPALYYFKMTSSDYEFLFFNNGDEGYFCFEGIEEVLQHDIYGYTWEAEPREYTS